MAKFRGYRQLDSMDCGPTCLRMVARHHGCNFSLSFLSKLAGFNKGGTSLLGLCDTAEKINLNAYGIRLSIDVLKESDLPCILHWRQNHFVVLYKIRKNKFYIADPAEGLITIDEIDFKTNWIDDSNDETGVALFLSPNAEFHEQIEESVSGTKWAPVFKYILSYRKLFIQLIIALMLGSLIQLFVPFLTQAIVDVGINTKNLNFIYLVIIAQATLIISRVSAEFFQSWLLLHISTRVNISILTDFFVKLMRLPMSFFDTKMTGDIMQRIDDQKNIEIFLTETSLNICFSLFNFTIFSTIFAYYNLVIFGVFITGTFLYITWIVLFLRRRRTLNYKNFEVGAKSQSIIVQLVNGMQEIKLNNCEEQKRWEWEYTQAKVFKFNLKNLALSQYQHGGATLIIEGTNLLITALSAKAVIDNHLTFGAMIALQYIIGQLNSPIQQFLSFTKSYQNAQISLERLDEIQTMSDEEPTDKNLLRELPSDKTITINNLRFCYPGAGNIPILKGIDIRIQQGKTTAIVGSSGSGKSTLLKLLLRFYEIEDGIVNVGEFPLADFSYKTWRRACGVVMQDGFIFTDTIEKNIVVDDRAPDPSKLLRAINIANIREFIEELPLGLDTIIGVEGVGISHGQRQRILIARAVYKDPEYIFFDEATNALDATNERVINDNLKAFFTGKTVTIVAHRLSTVSHADNIVVLCNGKIVEQGSHQELIALSGEYYRLFKNQLDQGTD